MTIDFIVSNMISYNGRGRKRFEKRMIEVLKAPREMRFKEIETILRAYDYKLMNVRGSHFRYCRENAQPVTMVVHHNKVKKVYVVKLFKLLLFYL